MHMIRTLWHVHTHSTTLLLPKGFTVCTDVQIRFDFNSQALNSNWFWFSIQFDYIQILYLFFF